MTTQTQRPKVRPVAGRRIRRGRIFQTELIKIGRAMTRLFMVWLWLGGTAMSQDCDLKGWKFFIDPGHGGHDSGGVGPTGLQEKEVALDIGLQLRGWLEGFGATVEMSRTEDVFVSLADRADQANRFGADRFVSIHINYFNDPSAHGTSVHVVPAPRPVTRDLGQQLLDQIVAYIDLRNRGLKFSNFAVLVRTRMPAALTESAFISNPYEESLLRDPPIRRAITEAHAYALCYNAYAFGPAEPTDRMGPQNPWPPSLAPPYGPVPSVSIRDGQVWVDRDGKTERLTDDTFSYSNPKLSPTLDKVLVTGRWYAGNALFVIDLRTGEKYDLSVLGVGRSGEYFVGYEGTWSQDGQRVLCQRTLEDGHTDIGADLYVIDLSWLATTGVK